MKRKILALFLVLVLVFSSSISSLAVGDYYAGDDYYNKNYSGYYSGKYYMSDWTHELQVAYEPTWYESPQRQVMRGEAFLLYLRAVQRSLTRQGYTRLMSNYQRPPFNDYGSVNPYAQSEVDVLYSNGILLGYNDNTMKFSKLLSRAEMAAIYTRFNRIYFNMGQGYNQWGYNGYDSYYNNNYNGYYNNYMYTDIQGHWAAQDILTATANGVLNGVGYNMFAPNAPLTIEQIWKILDCCVGYQGLKRSDIAYAMTQTFKVQFGKNIDESYGTANGTKISSLSSTTSSLSVAEGKTKNVEIRIYPSSASYQKLNWTSSNNNCVTIEEAWNSSKGTAFVTIYGRRATSSPVTVTGRAMDGSGKTVTIRVTVTGNYDYDSDYDNGYISSITPSDSVIYLDEGETQDVSARIYPSNVYNKNVRWTSSNSSIADVVNTYVSGNNSYAEITGNSEGTAYIYVKAQDGSGEQATIKVVVSGGYNNNTSYVTSATAYPSSVNAYVGDTETVSISLYPSNATNSNVTWVSDNQNIATVYKVSNTSIRITGVGVGSTTVRGFSTSGNQICAIPVTFSSNTSYDNTAPQVQITGATVIKRDEFATITVTAHDDNLASFDLKKSDILGLTGCGVSVHSIVRVSQTEYQVTLLGVEVSIGEVCIAAGVAKDTSGNTSEETDGVVIKVLARD